MQNCPHPPKLSEIYAATYADLLKALNPDLQKRVQDAVGKDVTDKEVLTFIQRVADKAEAHYDRLTSQVQVKSDEQPLCQEA